MKTKELASKCFMRITSFSPRTELVGLERTWIEKCITNTLDQQNSDLLKEIDELKMDNELLLKEQKIKNIQYNKLDDRFNNYVLTTEKQLIDISDKKAKLQSQLSESNARVKELEVEIERLKNNLAKW